MSEKEKASCTNNISDVENKRNQNSFMQENKNSIEEQKKVFALKEN